MGEQGMDKQKLRDLGIDVDSALERLGGNEVMLERLLKAFLVDPNYGELSEALGERDTDKAFAAVHTLKGVCISLSLDCLYEPVSEMTEYLRAGDLASAQARFPAVSEVCEQLTASLLHAF